VVVFADDERSPTAPQAEDKVSSSLLQRAITDFAHAVPPVENVKGNQPRAGLDKTKRRRAFWQAGRQARSSLLSSPLPLILIYVTSFQKAKGWMDG